MLTKQKNVILHIVRCGRTACRVVGRVPERQQPSVGHVHLVADVAWLCGPRPRDEAVKVGHVHVRGSGAPNNAKLFRARPPEHKLHKCGAVPARLKAGPFPGVVAAEARVAAWIVVLVGAREPCVLPVAPFNKDHLCVIHNKHGTAAAVRKLNVARVVVNGLEPRQIRCRQFEHVVRVAKPLQAVFAHVVGVRWEVGRQEHHLVRVALPVGAHPLDHGERPCRRHQMHARLVRDKQANKEHAGHVKVGGFAGARRCSCRRLGCGSGVLFRGRGRRRCRLPNG